MSKLKKELIDDLFQSKHGSHQLWIVREIATGKPCWMCVDRNVILTDDGKVDETTDVSKFHERRK